MQHRRPLTATEPKSLDLARRVDEEVWGGASGRWDVLDLAWGSGPGEVVLDRDRIGIGLGMLRHDTTHVWRGHRGPRDGVDREARPDPGGGDSRAWGVDLSATPEVGEVRVLVCRHENVIVS